MDTTRMRPLPRASDALIDRLRSQILTGELPLGFQLPPEAELIRRYGASRAAVRDAIRQLEIEGLLLMRRGRNGGAVVRHPDLTAISRGLASAFTIREVPVKDYIAFALLIEPPIAAEAAENATSDQREELIQLAEGKLEPSGHLDVQDRSLHTELARSSHNRFYSTLLESLQPFMERAVHIKMDQESNEVARKEHIHIAKAVHDGDAEAARFYMQRHIMTTKAFLSEHALMSDPVVPAEAWTRIIR